MPSTTAGGLPYPLPGESVRDGALAIKNLADAIQLRGGAQALRGGRSDLVATTGGLFKIVFTDMVVTGIAIQGMIPGNAVATVTATEGAGGGGQRSAIIFQLWQNGVALGAGASCAVMWVAVGTP